MVYFDNSATTPVDPEVAQRAVELMVTNFGNPSSLHYLGAQAYTQLGVARNQLAKMLGARTSLVHFTSGGTESNNIAIQGSARGCAWGGKHIVTTAVEHDSVLKACKRMELEGWRVTYVNPAPATHCIMARDVVDAVREDTVLVSAMFVNNETGELLPIREIAAGVRAKNPRTLIHCDCVQGFGKLPFKLHVYDVDMVSASAHKIHGPKGVGMLYLRHPELVQPLEYGGSQESRINPGTENVPLACAFGLAADRALYTLQEHADQAAAVRTYLLQRLRSAFPGLRVNSPAPASPFILNVSFPGLRSHELITFLSLRDIYLSAGSACSKGAASHVLEAMGCGEETIEGALRISISKYNTEADVDTLLSALQEFPPLRTP